MKELRMRGPLMEEFIDSPEMDIMVREVPRVLQRVLERALERKKSKAKTKK